MSQQQYIHTATGRVFYIPSRGSVIVAGQQIGPGTSEAALFALGCERYTPPPQKLEEPQPPGPVYITPRQLLDLLDYLGIEGVVMSLVESDPRLLRRFYGSLVLSPSDPFFKGALPAMAKAASMTEEQALQEMRDWVRNGGIPA